MNRKQRKLIEIRQSNLLYTKRIIYDTIKINSELHYEVFESLLNKSASHPKWAKRKFDFKFTEAEPGFMNDDFIRDLITIKRKFLAIPKKIRQKAKKHLRIIK